MTAKKNSSSKNSTRSSASKPRRTGSSAKTRSSNETSRRSGAGRTSSASSVSQDILFFGILAVSVLLFAANFGAGGIVGRAVSGALFGTFGLVNYAVPFLLLAGTFYGMIRKWRPSALKKLAACIVLILAVCLFIELLTNGSFPFTGKEAFEHARTYHNGGGFLGGFLSNLLQKYFGLVGAYIFSVVFMIGCILFVTETSAVHSLADRREEAREYAREEARMRREERQLSREVARAERMTRRQEQLAELEERTVRAKEQERAAREARRVLSRQEMQDSVTVTIDDSTGEGEKRRNQKVSGVNFHVPVSDTPADTPAASDEMKEIRIHLIEEASDGPVIGAGQTPADVHELHAVPEEESAAPSGESEPAPVRPIQIHGVDFEEASGPASAPVFEEPAPAPVQPVQSRTADAVPDDSVWAEPDPEMPEPAEQKVSSSLSRSVTGVSHKEEEPAAEEDVPVPAAPPAAIPRESYVFPPISLLHAAGSKKGGSTRESLQSTADKLVTTLRNFGVNVTVTDVSYGPSITRYEIQPESGVKVSRIVNLSDDIALNLAASNIRIEAPIPGKAAVGIEVPNKETVTVSFRELMESDDFRQTESKIAFGAGRDIAGKIIISDIAKMPHLLIAGATGSGKSVCINTIIMSILYKAHPDDVKLIMIDPKVVELSVYNDIPHLLIPVVTDPKKAAGALNWAVHEMEDRYNKFAEVGVRDMKGYNSLIHDGAMTKTVNGESIEIATPKMPQIVVIVDELADLMMVSSSEVEQSICRLAQLARAAGIHLVIATQRPSVNVITGLIKANMPSRIAFSVTSGVDSRTILDMVGAEKLLGKGDMLYYPQGIAKPLRVQGAFVSDDEVQAVVKFIKTKNPQYVEQKAGRQEEMLSAVNSSAAADGSDSERDPLFEDAGRLIVDKEKASIGMLQRNFRIGFNRAARIMDQLADAGVVGPEEGTKARQILMTMDQFDELV